MVFNDLFDPVLGSLSARYESSQAASGHFSSFARGLAQSWLERYELRGRSILEVGCGGGDFLRLLAKEGAGRLIGIDPCCASTNDDSITWISDRFDEQYLDLDADALVCRHTLEHIQDVSGFLQLLRKWALRNPARVFLFELPASERVFAERAFWDVYYEHCNYFTADTVRHAFERNGFDVLRVEHAYGGQYLIVEAVVATLPVAALTKDPAQTTSECLRYAADVAGSIERFRNRLHALAQDDAPLVLWQGASKTVGLLTAIGNPDWIACAIDLSPQRHEKFLPGSGLPVHAPQRLVDIAPKHIVLMNPVYLEEVRAQVRDLGVAAQVYAVNELLA